MRIRMIACSLLCSIFIPACNGDPIRPEDLVGTYTLVPSPGRTMPELLAASESCDQWLVAGTLSMQSGAAYSLVLDIENDCTRGGGVVVPEERTSAGTFTLFGRILTLTADSGTLSAEEFTGFFRRGTIEIIVPDLAVTGDLHLFFTQVFAQ